jgi:uncharacterized protein YjaZ
LTIEFLKNHHVWDKTKQLLQKYKKEWSGSDVPIFIFPIPSSMFRQGDKNGYSFGDKMFLFLPANISDEELEALFVHEYHHICRLKKTGKRVLEHTLLDSIIMEGLAEHAVLDYCGKQYLLRWNSLYSTEALEKIWIMEYKPNLNVKYGERLHGQLLYGRPFSRPLLGYTMGFYLVDRYRKNNENFSIPSSISVPSEQFII